MHYAARVTVSPNDTLAQDVIALIARAAACPSDASKSAYPSPSFYRYFGQASRAANCSGAAYCRTTPSCSSALVGSHFQTWATREEALHAAIDAPGSVDAVLDLGPACEALRGWRGVGGGLGPLRYTIHMNHSAVPPTRLKYGLFDLVPPKHYARYWFFVNLQTLVDSALVGAATGNDAHSRAGR